MMRDVTHQDFRKNLLWLTLGATTGALWVLAIKTARQQRIAKRHVYGLTPAPGIYNGMPLEDLVQVLLRAIQKDIDEK